MEGRKKDAEEMGEEGNDTKGEAKGYNMIKDLKRLKETRGLKIGHLNVRSVKANIAQLRVALEDEPLDIFCISESWLREGDDPTEFKIEGYEMERVDRCNTNNKGGIKRGGGVAIYSKKATNFRVKRINEASGASKAVEMLTVLIQYNSCRPIYVTVVYRPPDGKLGEAIEEIQQRLGELSERGEYTLVGDFNVDFSKKSAQRDNLMQMANRLRLEQLIKSPTRSSKNTSTVIDLIFTSTDYKYGAGVLEIGISDHDLVYMIRKKEPEPYEEIKFKGRKYSRLDERVLIEHMKETNWRQYYGMTHPGDCWKFIVKRVENILDQYCPVRDIHIKKKKNEWVSAELLDAINERERYRKIYKKHKIGSNERIGAYEDYKKARGKAKKMADSARCEFSEKIY